VGGGWGGGGCGGTKKKDVAHQSRTRALPTRVAVVRDRRPSRQARTCATAARTFRSHPRAVALKFVVAGCVSRQCDLGRKQPVRRRATGGGAGGRKRQRECGPLVCWCGHVPLEQNCGQQRPPRQRAHCGHSPCSDRCVAPQKDAPTERAPASLSCAYAYRGDVLLAHSARMFGCSQQNSGAHVRANTYRSKSPAPYRRQHNRIKKNKRTQKEKHHVGRSRRVVNERK